MKRSIVLCILSFKIVLNIYGQQSPSVTDPAYQKGDVLVNTGFSFGYYNNEFGGTRNLNILPITASIEWGLQEYFSAGPYIGYASWKFAGLNDISWQFISVGLRVSFHYTSLLTELIETDINQEKFDFYLLLITGYEIRTLDRFSSSDQYNNQGKLIIGPSLGFKYLFNPHLGIYLEGGKGTFGYGTLGVAFKF
ncbi:MAG: hypothetical protein ACNS62_01550 [Candidatus Cyclobacteriaceae bacterium M3_2C_046]